MQLTFSTLQSSKVFFVRKGENMKRREVRQQKTIIAMTPEEWDEKVNAALATMLDDTRKEPTIERTRAEDGCLMAVIEYWKLCQEAESIRDDFYLHGIEFRCDDCPQLRHINDKRVKWLECAKGMKDYTRGESEACDWYYEQVWKARGEKW